MPRLSEVQQFLSSGGARVYRIPCKVLGELTGRVYLVLGAGEPTLVDAGSGQGESTQNILDGLDAVRRAFGESTDAAHIKRIIVTHGHLDHYGGLGELLARMTAEVWIHPLDSRAIAAPEESAALARHAARQVLVQAGVPEETGRELLAHHWLAPREPPAAITNVKLLETNAIDDIRVLHSPGHSPGHVCLLVDDLLLCGDHILPRTIPQLWPESLRPYKGLGHYLESLDRVRAVPGIRLALPGHEAIIEDVYRRIDEIRRSQTRRIQYVADLMRRANGPTTIWQIARGLYQQTAGFFALLAFMDAASRVEYLHQRGALRVANLEQIESDPRAAWQYVLD
ncbi:MAG: MBL fold metallo-hydrolase [Pirellulales bacterium]|nr:MBL fold metallo-hydrolase [Pirellulales bacterium]